MKYNESVYNVKIKIRLIKFQSIIQPKINLLFNGFLASVKNIQYKFFSSFSTFVNSDLT